MPRPVLRRILRLAVLPICVLMLAGCADDPITVPVSRAADQQEPPLPDSPVAEQAPAASKPQPIYRTPEPVQIDGVLDDACWARAHVVAMDFPYGRAGAKSENRRGTARFAWDEYFLYIGYEVFDENVVAVGMGVMQGPQDNRRERCYNSLAGVKVDVVEFFLSTGDEHFFWEVHHNAANQFSDMMVILLDETWPIRNVTFLPEHRIIWDVERYIQDDGAARFAKATRLTPSPEGLPTTMNDTSDVDGGWTGELRLPWHGIGGWRSRRRSGGEGQPHRWAMNGFDLHILSVAQNGDTSNTYFHSSPTLAGGFFHWNFDHWPTYRCVNETGPADARAPQ